jgi:ribose-phosphate pyrophosphokinase
LARIRACTALKEVVITDTIPFKVSRQNPKIKVVSVAPLLADAIQRIHNEESVSSLFFDTRS